MSFKTNLTSSYDDLTYIQQQQQHQHQSSSENRLSSSSISSWDSLSTLTVTADCSRTLCEYSESVAVKKDEAVRRKRLSAFTKLPLWTRIGRRISDRRRKCGEDYPCTTKYMDLNEDHGDDTQLPPSLLPTCTNTSLTSSQSISHIPPRSTISQRMKRSLHISPSYLRPKSTPTHAEKVRQAEIHEAQLRSWQTKHAYIIGASV